MLGDKNIESAHENNKIARVTAYLFAILLKIVP